MLEKYKTETYIFKLCINTLQAERYTGKKKRVMLRELGSETNDRATRGREHWNNLFIKVKCYMTKRFLGYDFLSLINKLLLLYISLNNIKDFYEFQFKMASLTLTCVRSD
jgi:hypothetical protein